MVEIESILFINIFKKINHQYIKKIVIMHKIFLASLILLLPLPVLSETNEEIDKTCLSSLDDPTCVSPKKSQMKIQPLAKEDKKYTISAQTEFNSLGQYGIIDYASAVYWCRKKISDNYYDYELQIERISSDPADFCRTYFIPSIQSKSRRICVECDLDPNLILANLVEAIKQPRNRYGSDLDIPEEVYSEGNLTPNTYISENSKSLSDQPEENSKSLSDQPEENSKSLSDQPEENSKSLSDQHEENSKSLSDQPEENSKSLSDQPEENSSKSFSVQPEENSKGSYFTSSIGGSKIGDIDVQGVNSVIEFEAGLGLDIGIGYDFGRTRLEASWVRGQSDKVSWLGYSIESDSRIDSVLASYYYDFQDDKKWSPFIGASIGSTNVDIDGVEDNGFTYGIGYGLSYKTSEVMDVFVKGQTMVIPELDFGTISIENGNYTNGTIGIRYRF